MKNNLLSKNIGFNLRTAQLEKLVAFRNALQNTPYDKISQSIDEVNRYFLTTLLLESNYLNDKNGFSYLEDNDFFFKGTEKIRWILENEQIIINNFVEKLSQDINHLAYELGYYDVGYKVGEHLYNVNLVTENGKIKTLDITPDTDLFVKAQIQKYTGWDFPAMEIGVSGSRYTDSLVAADPVYLTDCDLQGLHSKIAIVNESMKYKFRPYYIDSETLDYRDLPKGQMSFILAWNVLRYYPQKVLTFMLAQLYDILTPGGRIFFDINNCDYPHGVRMVEAGESAWMNKVILLNITEELGFEIEEMFYCEDSVTTVLLRKPGELKTTKVSPSIGKIGYIKERAKENQEMSVPPERIDLNTIDNSTTYGETDAKIIKENVVKIRQI